MNYAFQLTGLPHVDFTSSLDYSRFVLDAAFEHGRYRPAGAAQIDKKLLRKGCAVFSDQHRRSGAAESRRGAIVTAARLLVQRLHATP